MAEEKKIIIDEDWKSQVQAEKEQAAKRKPEAKPAEVEADSGGVNDVPMPDASFELLLTTLATEALVAMGQLPHPGTGKMEAQRNQAKYLIDTLDVLREKTKNNLSPDEHQLLESMLHQLRMLFIQTAPTTTAAAS